jgi:hypothetical protein
VAGKRTTTWKRATKEFLQQSAKKTPGKSVELRALDQIAAITFPGTVVATRPFTWTYCRFWRPGSWQKDGYLFETRKTDISELGLPLRYSRVASAPSTMRWKNVVGSRLYKLAPTTIDFFTTARF